jgi:hypothetical protein
MTYRIYCKSISAMIRCNALIMNLINLFPFLLPPYSSGRLEARITGMLLLYVSELIWGEPRGYNRLNPVAANQEEGQKVRFRLDLGWLYGFSPADG